MVLLPACILSFTGLFDFLPGSSSPIFPLPLSLAFFYSSKVGATAFTSQPFLVKHTYGLNFYTNENHIGTLCMQSGLRLSLDLRRALCSRFTKQDTC